MHKKERGNSANGRKRTVCIKRWERKLENDGKGEYNKTGVFFGEINKEGVMNNEKDTGDRVVSGNDDERYAAGRVCGGGQ